MTKREIISIHAPSRERHDRVEQPAISGKISIHAPSRERQTVAVGAVGVPLNFNPRSLAGATWLSPRSCSAGGNFNPRSLAGATPVWYSIYKQNKVISIHAPSRERHLALMLRARVTCNFNPRSLAGATGKLMQMRRRNAAFQSTLPRGSDSYFFDAVFSVDTISIHAPSRERHHRHAYHVSKAVFQSTLPRGSDMGGIGASKG